MQLEISLPSWAIEFERCYSNTRFVSDEEKMQLAIELSRQNIINQTGGPFGAAIFNRDSGKLLSVGMNLVTGLNCCVAHAEIVAIIQSQQILNTYDLSTGGSFELISSTEPCCMCMGAVVWSGVGRLVCGATDADARSIGFDEGPKPDHWQTQYNQRGIEVKTEFLRAEAAAVLAEYKNAGNTIYNPNRN